MRKPDFVEHGSFFEYNRWESLRGTLMAVSTELWRGQWVIYHDHSKGPSYWEQIMVWTRFLEGMRRKWFTRYQRSLFLWKLIFEKRDNNLQITTLSKLKVYILHIISYQFICYLYVYGVIKENEILTKNKHRSNWGLMPKLAYTNVFQLTLKIFL